MEKVWVIYDGRANTMPTEDCAVYCAYSSEKEEPDEELCPGGFDGYTLEMVKKERDEEWPDGVIFEYDEVKKEDGKNYLDNQTLIG
jgi:hypothetical protein